MPFDKLAVALDLDTTGYSAGSDRAEDATDDLAGAAAGLSTAAQRAAEGLDDIGSETVRTAAGASAAESTTDALGEELTDTATSAALAANRLDAAGDEMTETAAKAATASGGIAGLRASMFGLSGSLTAVVPAVAGVAAALTAISVAAAPVITGLAGIAAGFVTVAGVLGGGLLAGAVTHMEELKSAVAAAKTEVKAAIEPVGELFGPLLVQAVEALPRLVSRIVDATGSLVPFRDAMQRIGKTAMTAIPRAAEAFANFARQTLPLFEAATTGIMQGLAPALQYLSGELSDLRSGFGEVAGPLREFWNQTTDLRGAVGRVINQIQRFAKLAVIAGAKIGGKLLPVFTPLVDGLAGALKALNDVAAALLGVGDQTDKTASKIRAFATAIVTGFRDALSAAKRRINEFGTAIRTRLRGAFQKVEPIVSTALGRVQSAVDRVTGEIKTLWDEHGGRVRTAVRDTYQFVKANPRSALQTLATVIVPGPLGLIVDAFKENWGKVKRNTNTTMEELKKTSRTAMQAVKRQIVQPLQTANSETGTNLGQIQTEFEETWKTIQKFVSEYLGRILDVQNEHTKEVGKLWRTHLKGEDGILANARTAFNSLWNNIIKPILDTIQTGWDMFGDELMAIAEFLWDGMLTLARTSMDLLLTAINVTLDLISGDWEGAWENIREFFERTFNRIIEFAEEWGPEFLEWLGGLLDDAYQAFVDFANDLIFGSLIPEMFGAIFDEAESFGEDLVSTLKGALGDVVDAFETKLSTVEGLASDIISTAESAASSAQSALADARDAAEDAANIDIGGGGGGGGDDDDGGGGGGGNGRAGGGTTSGGSDTDGGRVVGGGYVPGFDRGGLTRGEGLAYLHPNEAILPVEAGADAIVDAMEGGGGDTITIEEIYVDGQMDERELVRRLKQELTRELQRNLTR